jgi:hypothetical protein
LPNCSARLGGLALLVYQEDEQCHLQLEAIAQPSVRRS